MSHFTTLKTKISNTEILLETLREDFTLKPNVQNNQIVIKGSQFNLTYTLFFNLLDDGNWAISGDLYYVNRSRLGGESQNFSQNLITAYTRRLLQQQLEQNGYGWTIQEEKQTPQGGTTFTIVGPAGESIEANLSRDGGSLQVGVNNALGTACVNITSHLTTAYEIQKQDLKQEYYEGQEYYLLTEQYR